MDFILFLCIEIDSQPCLHGVRFTIYIPELSDEPQSRPTIFQEYIINLENQMWTKRFIYPSVEFNLFPLYKNC
ncbi:hypothetical protein IMSAGC008_02131 [Muribaculaceae bacterium]|nr:hypothetical protein IMSAGC008_02131 [Muribaculaceae bacterium]